MSQDSSDIVKDKWIAMEYIILNKKNSVNVLQDKARRILFCDDNNGNIFLLQIARQYSINFGNFNNCKQWLGLFFKSQEKQENIFNEFGENEMFNAN